MPLNKETKPIKIVIPLIIMRRAWLTPKPVCYTKEKLKARITTALTRLAGYSEVVWGSWLKPMAISLNKFNLYNFKIFSCNFGEYI